VRIENERIGAVDNLLQDAVENNVSQREFNYLFISRGV